MLFKYLIKFKNVTLNDWKLEEARLRLDGTPYIKIRNEAKLKMSVRHLNNKKGVDSLPSEAVLYVNVTSYLNCRVKTACSLKGSAGLRVYPPSLIPV